MMKTASGINNSGQNMNLLGSVQMLGIMNSLKTGDPTMDTVLAMLLPVFMSWALNWLNKQKDYILRYFTKKPTSKQIYRRNIVFQAGGTNRAVGIIGGQQSEEESYNNLLIKALGLYIHSQCKLTMDDADLRLTTIGTDRVMDDEDQFVQNNSRNKTTSTGQLLKQCEIIKQPIKATWHNVGTYEGAAVKVYYEESSGSKKKDNGNNSSNNDNKDGGGQNNMKLILESTGPQSVDCFIDTAYHWYKDELKKLENDTRYLYDFCSMSGSRNSRLTPVYTRYLLGEEKSFENLFCKKQTTALLRMVDEFQSKGGKYGIPGFPHKLGLLLHGKPGTGKTSLIKALAKYTRRQIVTVPLSRIPTNHGLMAVMFNKVCTVAGLQKAVKLGQEDVIYVLEDVDAASSVVKCRRLKAKEKEERRAKRAQEEAEANKEAKTTGTSNTNNTTTRSSSRNSNDFTPSAMPDALSLAGLLNALDGIVDTPGRIVILTTNHPEMLDEALVRAGRIDKKIHLGDMELEDAQDMMEHYFRVTLTVEQRDRLTKVFTVKRLEITPAELEQLIMAEPAVEGLIQKLEVRCGLVGLQQQQSSEEASSTSSRETDDGSTVMISGGSTASDSEN